MALIGTEVAGESWPPAAPPKGEDAMTLNRYDVEVNGVMTTLLLDDADAKARGLKADAKKAAPAAKKAAAPANKARTTTAEKRAAVAEKAWQGKKTR
jgi:hypothetical protein